MTCVLISQIKEVTKKYSKMYLTVNLLSTILEGLKICEESHLYMKDNEVCLGLYQPFAFS